MSPSSPYILARAKKAAEHLREAAQIMGQLEKLGNNRKHGRDILHAQAIAADLDLHYRLTQEKTMTTLIDALKETPEQFAERMAIITAKRDEDHAKRKAHALEGIDVNEFEFTRDALEIDFTGELCGMTIAGLLSYTATFDNGGADVGIEPHWEIDDISIRELTVDYGSGFVLRDIPHNCPFATAILEAAEDWLEGKLEGEEPSDERDD